MPYPIPIQVHVIWHPDSEDICFPLAKKLYLALNRDSYQPLVPGIGIPVFFRCAGANPARPKDVPAPIAVLDTEYDLRTALAAPKLLLDQAWCKYVADNFTEVADMRDRATLLVFGKPIPNSAVKAVVMDLKDQHAGEHILQHVLLQACRLIAQRLPREGADNLGAAPLKLFLSHTKRDKVGLKVALRAGSRWDGRCSGWSEASAVAS